MGVDKAQAYQDTLKERSCLFKSEKTTEPFFSKKQASPKKSEKKKNRSTSRINAPQNREHEASNHGVKMSLNFSLDEITPVIESRALKSFGTIGDTRKSNGFINAFGFLDPFSREKE